jgi:hypothetical protein
MVSRLLDEPYDNGRRQTGWATAVIGVGLHALRTSCAVPTLAQVYEGNAADYTRAAEQTDDPVFRNMLLTLALQWRLAAQEEAAKQSTEPRTADHAH